jgi:branched-chain amino acid transport system permease protein
MNPLQDLFTGLSVGLVYGVIGLGFVVVHRITGMVNFAQGELATVGAFGAVVAVGSLPPGLSVVVGALAGAAAGALLYCFVVHPLRDQGLLVQTIATLGAAIVLRSAAQLKFGSRPYSIKPFTDGPALSLGNAVIARQAIWLLALTAVVYLLLSIFFDHTMTGRAMSACAINRYAAGIVGINVVTMALIAFVISGAVTGLIAGTAVPLAFATASSGLTLALKGFIAAILGGFDKIGLTIVGGVLVGFVESLSASTISTAYQEVIVLVALLVLLVVRPAGLTRIRATDRV